MLAIVVNKTDKVLALIKPISWKGTGMWKPPRENQHLSLVVEKDMKKN